MKIANLVIAGICFLFAAFQWNDPDPMLWIAVYAVVGVVALMAAFGKSSMILTGVIACVCAYLMGMEHHGVVEYLNNEDGQTLSNAMSKEHPYIEQTREYGGALIALLFVAFSSWSSGCCRVPSPGAVEKGQGS